MIKRFGGESGGGGSGGGGGGGGGGGNKNRFVNSISERRWETARSGERKQKERAGESTLPPSAITAAAN